MNMASFLAELRTYDIRVWTDGDRLRCDAPPGVLTPELKEQLRAHKAALMEFLKSASVLSMTHQQRALVPLQPRGGRLPIFAACGHNGDVFSWRVLASCLGPDQPFYGLQPPGADGRGDPLERVEDLAAYFAEQIRAFRPQGPYLLAGFCAGGTIALELAQQLRRSGAEIGLLAMVVSPHPHEFRVLPKVRRNLRDFFKEQWRRARKHAPALLLPPPKLRRYLSDALTRHRTLTAKAELLREDPLLVQRARVERATLAALARYQPAPYPGTVHLFVPGPEWTEPGGLSARWRGTLDRLQEHYGPAGSVTDNILGQQHGPVFTEIFRRCLDSVGKSRNRPEGDLKAG